MAPIPVMVKRNYKDTDNHIAPPKTEKRTTKKYLTLMTKMIRGNSLPPSQPRPTLYLQSPPWEHRENRLPTSNKPNSLPKFKKENTQNTKLWRTK